MIPLYKLLSLLIRVFSRPLINYTKKKHLKQSFDEASKVRRFFIWTGNYAHRIESKINRKFLKIQTQLAFKPLNDELACEKGIQFSYQIIFYAIVIGLPIYEMILSSNESKEKSDKLQSRLKSIQSQIMLINTQLSEAKKHSTKTQTNLQNTQIQSANHNQQSTNAQQKQILLDNSPTESQQLQKQKINQSQSKIISIQEKTIAWTQFVKNNVLFQIWKSQTLLTYHKFPNLLELNTYNSSKLLFDQKSFLLKYTYL